MCEVFQIFVPRLVMYFSGKVLVENPDCSAEVARAASKFFLDFQRVTGTQWPFSRESKSVETALYIKGDHSFNVGWNDVETFLGTGLIDATENAMKFIKWVLDSIDRD
jgi:hypothetical protein